jgi:hypothetical protein
MHNLLMMHAQDETVHINQLVPELVDQAFPELKDVYIIAEYSGDGNPYSDISLSEGRDTYTITLSNTLQDAPPSVLRGALSEQLMYVTKITSHPFLMNVQIMLSSLPSYAARFSRRMDSQLIRRGMGDDFLAYYRYVNDRLGSISRPRGSYTLEELGMKVWCSRL